MNKHFSLKNPAIRFLVYFCLLYIFWFIIYDVALHPQVNDETGKQVRTEAYIDIKMVHTTITISEKIIRALGFNVYTDGDRQLYIEGTSGIWIGDNCNAISLIALFAGFIIAYPGKINRKLWFIPLGSLIIFLLNILRMVVLTILDTYSRSWTEFNHTYTFNVIIYGVIFAMWIFWTQKLSGNKLYLKEQKQGE